MNTRLISTTHHRIVKPIAFAMAVMLVAALPGCTTVHELPDEYDLTVSSTNGGSVVGPGEGTFRYDSGEVVTLLAEADEGHQFVNWAGDVEGIDDVDAASTTITINGDCSITADFEPVPIAECELSVASTAGGSVTAPGEGTYTYDSDTVVDLVAVADECYEFVNWSGDAVADPYSANTTIAITIGTEATKRLTANFARLEYELTTNSTTFGSVSSPGEGTFSCDCGTAVELVAEPDTRCRFAGWSGDVEGIADVHAAQTTVIVNGNLSVTANFEVIPMVTAGIWHTVGLKSDGTVVATGSNTWGQCEVDDWSDIIQVAAGERHTVGLRSDGTVLTAGYGDYGEQNAGNWTDIVQVDCGRYHTVGLRSNGTVIAVGDNISGQCEVAEWTDIVRVVTGFYHTLGLKPDGTVVAVGHSGEGRLNVDDWTDIIQVGAGGHHTLGLKPDGSVVAVGRDNYGETDVSSWSDIVQVAGGCQASLGLKCDGTVVQSGWCESGQCYVRGWNDIIQVDAGIIHAVGLRVDGSVVAAGSNGSGQCEVADWMLG